MEKYISLKKGAKMYFKKLSENSLVIKDLDGHVLNVIQEEESPFIRL